MKKLTLFSSLFLIGMTLLSSSSSSSTLIKPMKLEKSPYEGQHLVIFNCEDYMAEKDESDPDYNDDIYDLEGNFEKMYGCTVDYYTFGTLEEMYNQLKLQKEGTYDLICASEYMIQKLAKEDLILPLNKDKLSTYYEYANTSLVEKLDSMKVPSNDENDATEVVGDYCAGYMWGTMGIVYDPNYVSDEDVKSWDVFWNEKYNNMASIKNSMRDTYVVGVLHAYKDELETAKEQNLSPEEYNAVVQEIFDRHDDETIEKVKQELISMKNNIYGFEVDSGKNDIITGKIKMNLAWSGDAVYSIDTGKDEADKLLKYSVPEEGSNIWYDGWVMPKGANESLAYEFINYISQPEIAAINMDFIGYTPFITSEEVFDQVASWYGASLYHDETTYYEENIVRYEDNYYICLQESTGNLPTNEEYFELYEEGDILDTPTDLSYYFEDYFADSSKEALIYPFEDCENQLETQYPTLDIINRCAFMNDFGEDNEKVIIMWGQVKAATNMIPYYIILTLAVIFVPCYFLIKIIKIKRDNRYALKRNTK